MPVMARWVQRGTANIIMGVGYIKGPVNSQGLLFKNYRLICTDS